MKNAALLVLFMLIFLINGCDDQPVVDPKITGIWYQTDEAASDVLGPKERFWGFRIREDGIYAGLGVETATGKIAKLNYQSSVSNVKTRSEDIIFRYVSNIGGVHKDTTTYRISSGELIIDDGIREGTYQPGEIGDLVSEPVTAEFHVNIDGKEYQNYAISTGGASAYLTINEDEQLSLRAMLPSETEHDSPFYFERIIIEVDDFSGPGEYSIGEEEGLWYVFLGDVPVESITDTDSSGTLTISSCDMEEMQCRGEFEFVTQLAQGDGEKVIDDGEFDLPVYK